MTDNLENEGGSLNEADDFNEKAEIEKLQDKIKRISEFNNTADDYITGNPELLQGEEDFSPSVNENELISFMESRVKNEDKEEASPKKFVVTADVKNVEYFDKLSVAQRSELFNEILSEYIKNEDKIKGKRRIKKTIIHFIIVVFTIIVAFPAAFYLVNKSIHLTVLNYKGAQVNFEKLYESKGIKVETKKKYRH